MWDLPGPGLEPVSPALARGFLTTAPPGRGSVLNFYLFGDTKRTKRMAYDGKKRTKGTVILFGKRSGKND